MTAISRSWLSVSVLLLLTAAGCGSPAEEAPVGNYGLWASEAQDSWPRIAMVNRIRYSDSDHPMAGTAFLLQYGDETVATTAKHVMRYFKSETMDSVSFQESLVSWEMFPKDASSDVTVIGALINEDSNESLESIRATEDWLLFTVERTSESVTPLRLRSSPMKKGETVFVVGWRYTDEGPQHVYEGEYVRSSKGSVLIDVGELTHNTMPGLSGAPVIDSRGYVIGMMSAKSGELQRLAPIDYPKRVLEQKPRPAVESRANPGCAQQMAEHFRNKGWVGITPEIDAAGVISVVNVFSDSPADKADVRRGDLVRGINGIPRDGDPAAFMSAYDSLRPGIVVVFDLERDGENLSVEIHVEPIPETVLEQWISQECP